LRKKKKKKNQIGRFFREKMAASNDDVLKKVFEKIDEREEQIIAKLAEVVAIRSVSSDPQLRGETIRQQHYLADWCKRLGFNVRVEELGTQPGTDNLQLPPIVLATNVNKGDRNVEKKKKKKKPVLGIYAHADVQPANREDGWATDPFVLTEVDGKLYGRGSTDDKGPLIGWLLLFEVIKEVCGGELPVDVALVFEGMEESGSVGLEEFVESESKARNGFFAGIDYFVVSDNYFLGLEKPCVTHGLRGLAYFELEVAGGTKDLHSGSFGGAVREAMTDLVSLMATLVDASTGKVLVDGVYDDVDAVTDEERARYEAIDFECGQFARDAGVDALLHGDDKAATLMSRWRFPTLSLHGIEGAFSGAGAKTVIPRSVRGKFSMRLVPSQRPDAIEAQVRAHIERQVERLGIANRVSLKLLHGAAAWVSPVDHPNYVAARNAIKRVHNVEPDLTREGGSIPIVSVLERASETNVCLLPIGASDDGAHGVGEKINRAMLLNGIKVFAAYLFELSSIHNS
jgi:cytosolic nonspecific dipeptidase